MSDDITEYYHALNLPEQEERECRWTCREDVPTHYAAPRDVVAKLAVIAKRTRKLEEAHRTIDQDTRIEIVLSLALIFREFVDFAYVGMRFLGFDLTDMQADIARYMQYGPRRSMVSAQRGEAKSTLAALYAVWCLIQNNNEHILIVSGGEKQASEVALLVTQLICQWHILCVMRPNPSRGDREAYDSFDINCDLKRLNKSPSVACVGITAQLQGKRATLLIPDDIETTKNGLTQTQREQLLLKSKEFAAINTHGKTLYLGTPQTKESIYKTLPSRGFEMRIWCGRIPSVEQEENFGDNLAPYIKDLIAVGYRRSGFGLDFSLGECTDIGRYDEDALNEKEEDFGPEGFQLQYMLDTSLSDAMRTRIKLNDFIVFDGNATSAPSVLSWSTDPRGQIADLPEGYEASRMYRPAGFSSEYVEYKHKMMVVDPAGCGGDELSFAAGGAASAYIHLFYTGGLQGGVCEENIAEIVRMCQECEIKDILIESNMGHGTVEALFMNYLNQNNIAGIGVRGKYNSTIKERRIIDSVSPVTRRHRLVIHTSAIEMDAECCMKYPRDRRWFYSALCQMRDITYDRGSLKKDDRADAIAMMVSELSGMLVEDENTAAEKASAAKAAEFLANPMGYDTYEAPRRNNTRARLQNSRSATKPRGVYASIMRKRRR